jgi:hypothetical protein
MFYLPAGTCCRNLVMLLQNILKSGELGACSTQKSFACVGIIFFRSKKCQNSCPSPPLPSPKKEKKVLLMIFLAFVVNSYMCKY